MIDCYNLNLNWNRNSQKKTLTIFDILDSYCHQTSLWGTSQVPLRNDAARVLLKDYVKGKLLHTHPPPHLSEKDRYLFQNGEIVRPKIEKKGRMT